MDRSEDSRDGPGPPRPQAVVSTAPPNPEPAGPPRPQALDRLQCLAESVSEVFWLYDTATRRYEYISPACERVFGLSPSALYNDPARHRALVHPADRARVAQAREQAARRAQELQYRIRRPDGTERWIRARMYPQRHRDGAAVAGVSADVTERVEAARALKQAQLELEDRVAQRTRELEATNRSLQRQIAQRRRSEAGLRESEERLRLLIEGVRDAAIFVLDVEGRVASWNAGAERVIGYRREEIVGRHFSVFYLPEDQARGLPEQMLRRALEHGSAEQDGVRVRADGSTFRGEALVTTLHDEGGRLSGFANVTRDRTERWQAEQALRTSEARYRTIVEATQEGVCIIGGDARVAYVNRRMAQMVGFSPEEVTGRLMHDFIDPQLWEEAGSRLARQQAGHAERFDFRVAHRDGHQLWVHVSANPLWDEDGAFAGALCLISDIGERVHAEQALRRSRWQLAEAQRMAHLGSWEWDATSDRLWWSEELCRLYGRDPGAPPCNLAQFLSYVQPEQRERVRDAMEGALRTGTSFHLHHRIVGADGAVRVLQSRGELLADGDAGGARLLGVCMDVTEQRQAQERLVTTSALLREMSRRLQLAQEQERRHIARELHDEIGQTLTAVKLGLQSLAAPSDMSASAALVRENIANVDRVLGQVRDLSLNLRPAMLDDLGLAAALRWYVDRQSRAAALQADIRCDAPARDLSGTVATACFRVVQEAVTNVVRHAGARRLWLRLEQGADTLTVRVRDDGTGFDAQAALDAAGQGASFGLLSMRERAELAGGRLDILSRPGEGTELVVRFPVNYGDEGDE